MRAAEQVERFVFTTRPARLVAAILLVMLLKTGVWLIPNLGGSLRMAQDPFVNPFVNPNAHALYWSWLGPFLAWLAGARGPVSFFLFHLLFSIGFTALFIATALRRLPEREARAALVLFALLPVSATAYFWVGADSLTLFLMMAAFALPPRRALALPLGAALGMQHFEQAFLGFAGLSAALLLRRLLGAPAGMERPAGWALALLAGVVLGKLLLAGLFHGLGVTVNSGRPYWLREHLPLLLAQLALHLHVVLWSALGLGWLVVLKHLERGREALPFLLVLAGSLLLLPVAGDQTRVFAIVTFPLLAAFWLLERGFLASLPDRLVAWLFLLWLLVPWSWVWGGVPRWSVFPYDVAYLLHLVLGWPALPANPAFWPFPPGG